MSVVLATGSYDHKIRFFEAPSGVNSKTLRAGAPVNCLEITPNKQFIAAGCNPQIRLFEINDSSNANPDPVLTLEGHTAAVTSLGFQRDVRYLFSGSEDGTVKIFDLRGPNASCTFDCKAPVNSVVHHPSRPEIISGDQNGIIRVWDLGTSKCINELAPDAHDYPSQNGYGNGHGHGNGNGGTHTNASRHREESIGASTGTGTGTGTNTSTSTSKSKSYGQKASIQSVDISEDGRTFIAANNHAYVFMWDPSDSSNFVPITKFHAHPTGTYLLKAKISPDCRQLVTCSSDQSARIYDISRPRDRERERGQERDMHGGDGKSNSNRNGNGNGNGNSNDGNSHNSNNNNNNNAHVNHNHSSSSSVNSNNSRNNTSNNATGSSINSTSCSSFAPKLIQSLTQHNKWVWDCVFSADSSYLVTASSDHSARLFNLRSGEVVRQYTGHQSAVTCVALNDSSS